MSPTVAFGFTDSARWELGICHPDRGGPAGDAPRGAPIDASGVGRRPIASPTRKRLCGDRRGRRNYPEFRNPFQPAHFRVIVVERSKRVEYTKCWYGCRMAHHPRSPSPTPCQRRKYKTSLLDSTGMENLLLLP
ncbi:hypothetical protein AAFF_G00125280 [Aldrovandia affinis]|uniref:Uncharacterized protein n=1 Tax=Aldrovandia affinis TaxID=143900 RepID=A0AAD7RRG6_9TELE|nr:hypothetical protein AAFF_G00125280 [Aldrovandia affinis]